MSVDRKSAFTETEITLKCTIARAGHEAPIPRGHFVELRFKNDVTLYTSLDGRHHMPPEERLAMKDAGVGLVCDYKFHAEGLEFIRAKLRGEYDDATGGVKSWELTDVVQNMYYYVMFQKGYFWVRWDWLVEVTKTNF